MTLWNDEDRGSGVSVPDIEVTLDEYSASLTLTENHYLVLIDGSVTVTLPEAETRFERMYTIKNVGTGVVKIKAYSGDDMEGKSEIELLFQYSDVTLVGNIGKWHIIGGMSVKMEEVLNDINESLNKTLSQILLITAKIEMHIAEEREAEIDIKEVQEKLEEEFSELLL